MRITALKFAQESLLSPTDIEIVEKQYSNQEEKTPQEWYAILSVDFVINRDIRKNVEIDIELETKVAVEENTESKNKKKK